MRTLAGQVAIVTGGSRGIGLAIARALMADGAHVAITGKSAAHLSSARPQIEPAGPGKLETFQADVRSYPDVERAVAGAAARFGGLDIVVNNAGVGIFGDVADMSPDQWSEVIDTNLTGVFYVCRAAIPHLRRVPPPGKIVNLADVAAFEPWPAYLPHCVSKAGVVMLTQGLARALAPEIAVNAVAPGAVLLPDDWDAATRAHFAETTPLKRLGSAEDVVSAVRFLLEGTDYVSGSVLVVDGGRLIR